MICVILYCDVSKQLAETLCNFQGIGFGWPNICLPVLYVSLFSVFCWLLRAPKVLHRVCSLGTFRSRMEPVHPGGSHRIRR